MSILSQRVKWLYRFSGSRELTLILFLNLAVVLILKTLVKTTDIQLGWMGRALFGVLGLNLLLCTVQRINGLSKTVIILHLGTITVMAGAVISAFGYVATVNIYEGTSVDAAYRWDLKRAEPLGFNLMVKEIQIEYYPIPIRVGVRRGPEKVGLFELKTGESFKLNGYIVRADSMEFPSENLLLSVFAGDTVVGSTDTSGMKNLPQNFPYDFVLVAFKNPRLDQVRVDLRILQDSKTVAEGITEINSPLTWGKHGFFNTSVNIDRFGIRYAGIQITNDPGKPYVYTGFAIIGIGSLMYFLRKVYE